MDFNFFRRPITLRQFLFYLLLSPIIFTVVIAIAKILEPSDLSSLKEKPMSAENLVISKCVLIESTYFLQNFKWF